MEPTVLALFAKVNGVWRFEGFITDEDRDDNDNDLKYKIELILDENGPDSCRLYNVTHNRRMQLP